MLLMDNPKNLDGGGCKAALGYLEALLRLRSLVFSLRRIVEYGYRNNWIQVQISGYDTISLLFLELFPLLILYRVVSLFGFLASNVSSLILSSALKFSFLITSLFDFFKISEHT